MLGQLERDVGLDRLSRIERDVLLAAHSLAPAPGSVVNSDQIRAHPMLAAVTQATYYRALRSLLSAGFLERAQGSKAKSYTVRSDRMEQTATARQGPGAAPAGD
ncbi:hypothetical protein [Mangrovicoccus ximenensis]|uniref:hypothetical protein n=1 Tax=Mangrovicoccus ximenensis TaxID=1911570 RepID=UPI002ED424FE